MKSRSHLIIGTLSTIEFSILTGIELTPVTLSVAAILSTIPDLDEPNSNVGSYIVSKKTTKKIHRLILYSLLLAVFYISYRYYNNMYIGVFFSIISILFLEKKVSENKVRSLTLALFLMIIGGIFLFLNLSIWISVVCILFSLFPLFKHRSFTHSIFMVLIIFSLMVFLEYTFKVRYLAIISSFAYLTHLLGDIITKRGIPIFYPLSKKYYSIGNLRVGYLMCNIVEYGIIILLLFLILYHISVYGVGNIFRI